MHFFDSIQQHTERRGIKIEGESINDIYVYGYVIWCKMYVSHIKFVLEKALKKVGKDGDGVES